MEPVQIILLIVIVILAILLTVLGVQVFLILREIRKTVEKANKVLDDAGVIAKSIAEPVSSLSSLVMGIKSGISIANWIKKTYSSFLEHTPHKEPRSSSEDRSEEVLESGDDANGLNGNGQANYPMSEGNKNPQKTESASGKPIRRFFKGIGKRVKIS